MSKILTVAMTMIASALLPATLARAEQFKLNGHLFTLPDGLIIEQIAGPSLVPRPISADFDEQGRLYVTDSSGTNDNVKTQLEERPHRIVRLEDKNGDGVFDTRVVFADKMMFPEGALWHAGSLYVAAPPEIWKLTDSDDDGLADRREVWFDGKTLTGCANDLHGPYMGPDGWIYWCKGAFAEQTHQRTGTKPLVTRASHIFRRRPEGGPTESVMAGGMDNPVDVVFTPGGERVFTTTFLTHPRDGKRDGLIHAIYGGVYGKQHSVIDGHPRTGELMPPLVHLGAAAPCGLARLETGGLGEGYRDNLLACLFNMHKITRHVLTREGGRFVTKDSDLLTSDKLDFHPTDVFEDADGSVIVVDTGGWYKLCCPTSQLHKPDILGGVYRIRRRGAEPIDDVRGRKIEWSKLDAKRLTRLLGDPRPVVRKRAQAQLVKLGEASVPAIAEARASAADAGTRRHAVWTLSRIDHESARAATRDALADADEVVRQAAAHACSVWRDPRAIPGLKKLLLGDSGHNRRAAAEALGRIGDPATVPALLDAAARAEDRIVEHSLTYALIEIADASRTRAGLKMAQPGMARSALIALDEMEGGRKVTAEQSVLLLNSPHAKLRETAWWLAGRHPEWAPALAGFFREQLLAAKPRMSAEQLVSRLARFAGDARIQQVMADVMSDDRTSAARRLLILDAMASSGVRRIPASWSNSLLKGLSSADKKLLGKSVATALALSSSSFEAELVARLMRIGSNDAQPPGLRVEALAAAGLRSGKPRTADRLSLPKPVLTFIGEQLRADNAVRARSLAVDVLTAARLDRDQLTLVAQALRTTGPMELKRLLPLLAASKNARVGEAVIKSLENNPSAASISIEELKSRLAGYGDKVKPSAERLVARVAEQNRDRIRQFEVVLGLLEKADIRRGQQLFHNAKMACAACHQMGYLGGRIGPDLSRIGRIRSERDLLESVMFPSVSFVRSFEPVSIITTDGRVFNGVVRDETQDEVILSLDAQKVARIRHDEIDERSPGKVSIMPAGLDKQLKPQELADLIRFLKSR